MTDALARAFDLLTDVAQEFTEVMTSLTAAWEAAMRDFAEALDECDGP